MAMASVTVTRTEIVVGIHGWNIVRAMRSSLRIPLGRVTSVRLRPKEGYFDDAIIEPWRGIGTYSPGKVACGLVYLKDGPSFYEVRDPTRAIAVDVEGQRMRHYVFQIDRETPESAVSRIEHAMDRYRGHRSDERITLPRLEDVEEEDELFGAAAEEAF
jgi:hypothetical protein